RLRISARRRHHAADRQWAFGAADRGGAARPALPGPAPLSPPVLAGGRAYARNDHGSLADGPRTAAAPRGGHRPARQGDAGGADLLRPSGRAARGQARRRAVRARLCRAVGRGRRGHRARHGIFPLFRSGSGSRTGAALLPAVPRLERAAAAYRLAARCFALNWIRRDRESRAVAVTPAGERGFRETFGM